MLFRVLLPLALLLGLQAGRVQAQATSSQEIAIPTTAAFTVQTSWFDGTACVGGNRASFYFQVGKEAFAIKPQSVERGMLKSPKAVQSPAGSLVARVSRTAGCQRDPLHFAQAELLSQSPELPKYIVLSETPSRSDAISPVTNYIRHLSKNGSCKTTAQPDLIMCSGSRTANGKQVAIAFMVVVNGGTSVEGSSGIPVHARCEDIQGEVVCSVSDEMANDVTVKAAIDGKNLVAEKIVSLRQKIVDFAAKAKAP
jgi:hypothetical protein